MMSHLLMNLGVPAAVAVPVGIAAMILRSTLGGKSGGGRGRRGQRPARDDH